MNTFTRDRILFVITANKKMVESAEIVLNVIKKHPEADEHFARVFGLLPPPQLAQPMPPEKK